MKSKRQRTVLLFASAFLVINQLFIGHDLKQKYRGLSTKMIDEAQQQRDAPEEQRNLKKWDAPSWSAFSRQHHKNRTEYDASIKWRLPGMDKVVKSRRGAMEVLTYGLSGVLPWYSKVLPAIKFDSPFDKTTQVQIVMVDGLVDATLDLHQCTIGRETEGETELDGYFDACFHPQASGRDAGKASCFRKGKGLTSKARIYDYPAPGHERWSCYDRSAMEQLAAAQVLDYFICHGDRLYRERTKNLFFFRDQRPVRFVSIDHHGDPKDFFRDREYRHWARAKILLQHDLPLELRDEIKRTVILGSKEEFVQKFNATIDGQLDNLTRVIADLYAERNPDKERPTSISDTIWRRLESVARFYNITTEDSNQSLKIE